MSIKKQSITKTAEVVTPKKRYSVIMADPPWDVQQKGHLGASEHYDLMTIEQIKGMGDAVKALAEDDAHLWLWVTNAVLLNGDAKAVMDAWGFTPRSPLTWVKPRIMLGNYLRNSTEHLIFATRGKAPVQFKSQGTWTFAPLQDHSHKPEEQYAIIRRVSGEDSTKLELFARRREHGWDAWGNEMPDSDVSLAPWGFPIPADFTRDERDSAKEAQA
ncbi:MT-A70 family methyltransferase [Microbacterium sp. NPDC076895]|uniref:MT-A70 family methyltransferase n=1 Tax=Microbacterium sp. NPDC076895 TaxID=3154957 RepID=UPI00342B74D5